MTEEMENCDECVIEKEDRIKQKKEEKRAIKSWFGLLEKVKNGPVSDIICIIPKIRNFQLFGDIFEVIPVHHLKKFQKEDYLILFKMVLKYHGDLDLCVYLSKKNWELKFPIFYSSPWRHMYYLRISISI